MFPYVSLLLAIVTLSLFDGKKYDKVIFFFLVIWMFVFSAFRVGGVGEGDYDAYLRFYSLIETFDDVINPKVHAEVGFRILSFVGHSLGFSGQYIIVTMALLALFPVVYVIYKYSPYKILSLLIWMPYFLTMNMHASRTSVAAGFGLLFLVFYFKKQKLLSLCSFSLSISFHSSALILILVFLNKLSLKTILCILVSVLMLSILTYPIQFLIGVLDMLGFIEISSSIREYIASDDYGYPMSLYDPRIIVGFLTSLLIYNYRAYFGQYFKIYYFKLYIIGIIIMIAFSDVVIMSWRVSYFFLLIGVIIVPWVSKVYNYKISEKIKVNRCMSLAIGGVYILYTFSVILNAQPYRFFL